MFQATTIRALLAIKRMLADADFPADLKTLFQPMCTRVRWCFTSSYLAIDFISAYGQDDVFGSATDRSVYICLTERASNWPQRPQGPDRSTLPQHPTDVETIEAGKTLRRKHAKMDSLVLRDLPGFPAHAMQPTPTDFMTNAGNYVVPSQYCASRELFRLLTLLASRIGTNTSFYTQLVAASTGDISPAELAREYRYTGLYDMSYSYAQPAKRLRTRLLSMWRELQNGIHVDRPLPLVFEVKDELGRQTAEKEAATVPRMSLQMAEIPGPSGKMHDGTWLFCIVIQLAALL